MGLFPCAGARKGLKNAIGRRGFASGAGDGAVDGGENALEGARLMLWVMPTPKCPVLALVPELDVCHRHGVGAHRDGVLLVVHKGELVHLLAVDGVEEGVNGAVAGALDLEDGVGVADGAGEGDVGAAVLVGKLGEGVAHELVGRRSVDVIGLEEFSKCRWG